VPCVTPARVLRSDAAEALSAATRASWNPSSSTWPAESRTIARHPGGTRLALGTIVPGYTNGVDLFHFWEPGPSHSERDWGRRLFRPLLAFFGQP